MANKTKLVKISSHTNPNLGWNTPLFLNGHHSSADPARELFKSALNGERPVVYAEKKLFRRCGFGLSGNVYKTTGCFDMLRQVSLNNP